MIFTGTIQSCTPTRDGRFLVMAKNGKNIVAGYCDKPRPEGQTAKIEDGKVL